MKTTNIFIIGANKNYSSNVIAGSYAVNNVPVYKEYEDANGTTHKFKIRDRVVGSFDMLFKTAEAFDTFSLDVKNNTNTTNYSVPCTLMVNNAGEMQTKNLYLEFVPVRNRNDAWQDTIEQFTVTVEER